VAGRRGLDDGLLCRISVVSVPIIEESSRAFVAKL